jgi:hypothetical protein
MRTRVLKNVGLVVEETRGKWAFYPVDAEGMAGDLRGLGALTAAGYGVPR